MSGAPIILKCRTCNRSMEYSRSIDPDIPAYVAVIEQEHCDECWSGQLEGETWFTEDGVEVGGRD